MQQHFKDESGREWQIVVNMQTIKAAREKVKVDLYRLIGDEAKRLFADPILLVDTLFVVCRAQCAERNVTDVGFAGLFNGDILETAASALLQAVIDFYPESRRESLRATVAKSELLANSLLDELMRQIDNLTETDLLKHLPQGNLSHVERLGDQSGPSIH